LNDYIFVIDIINSVIETCISVKIKYRVKTNNNNNIIIRILIIKLRFIGVNII